MVIHAVRKSESSGGFLLVMAALLAMIAVNSPLQAWYAALLDTPVQVRVGALDLHKPLLLWINDGLMAVFFFLVGLELKREVLQGELSDPARVALPIISAVGGMAVPALIYAGLNWDDPVALKGWAIPSATDIAFSLGVLSLLGTRAPHALKLFLLTLALADDLGAIVIIALFYTSDLSVASLALVSIPLALLFVLNRSGVRALTPYLLMGLVLWVAVLKSGVHATLAGVALAFFIPLRAAPGSAQSPLESLEHDLHPGVVYGILPLFAFANTGISFEGLALSSLLQPVPLGISAGLFLGKQLGVLGFAWLAVRLGLGGLAAGVTWLHMYGVAILCGIGFTMSLFISSLAFPGVAFAVDDRLGIVAGSLLSAMLGYLVLYFSLPKQAADSGTP